MTLFADSDDLMNPNCAFSFSKFPEDVQFCILSFLSHLDLLIFSCTSKRYASLCGDTSKLWYAICDRRWGSKTDVRKWGGGTISYKFLYRTLSEWDKLIGFWRRSGNDILYTGFNPLSLVCFEWGSSFVTAAVVSPSQADTYHVIKTPFLWMGLSKRNSGVVSFLCPDFELDLSQDFISACHSEFFDSDIVPVNVIFMGDTYVVIEENRSFRSNQDNTGLQGSAGSISLITDDSIASQRIIGEFGSYDDLPAQLISEIYHCFANRLSPGGGDKSSRKYRKREKSKQWRIKWEPLHLVKIVKWAPTPPRPLQGLWKGIGDNMKLDFYLVVYDDVGGIACRRVGDSSRPVFWTSSSTFIEAPLSLEEEIIYENCVHLCPLDTSGSPFSAQNLKVSRLIYINSSYDLVIPETVGVLNSYNVEGRAWLYTNGMFGFGFLRDNLVIDLSLVSEDLDLVGIS